MCGIMGYFSFGTTMPNKEKLKECFIKLEERGKDAAGFAFFKKKKLIVYKEKGTATELCKKHWKKLSLGKTMIFHTRNATQGTVNDNTNNHPIMKKNIALVHNGVISNEAEFGISHNLVDSLGMLNAYIEYKENIDKIFENVIGSFAIALLNKKKPKELILFRHSNPIELLLDEKDNILYFASKKEYLKPFLREKKLFNINVLDNQYYVIVKDNSSLIITPQGIKENFHNYKGYQNIYNHQNNQVNNDFNAENFESRRWEYSQEGRLWNREYVVDSETFLNSTMSFDSYFKDSEYKLVECTNCLSWQLVNKKDSMCSYCLEDF